MHEKLMNILTVHRNYFKIGLFVGGYLLAFSCILGLYAIFYNAGSDTQNNEPQSVVSKKDVDYKIIAPMHLFGFNEDSRLRKISNDNIKLVGIIYKDNASKAIMLINAKEQIFNLGDKVENVYTIQKIEPSRVIVATQDGFEEIGLFEALNQGKALKNDNANINNPPEFDSGAIDEQVAAQAEAAAQEQQAENQAQIQSQIQNNIIPEQAFKSLEMKRGFRGNNGRF
ncbi:MAG: hypothetical protein JSR17_07120 [Proteobacteria bacterium]|nr:hypothetical protein [Pseudomonadota bacterium]